MSETRDDPIDLALAADFRLGALVVNPSAREVTRGGWREMLEPRVMQVLVALAQADGAVVSRDALIARCWEGRVVGEDAINRAIGRLRRLSEADDGASFTVETIARVGYRLRPGQAGAQAAPAMATPSPAPGAGLNRRRLLAGGAGLAIAGAAGAGLYQWRRHAAASAIPPDVAAMIQAGKQAQRMGTAEAEAQAVALLEHAVQAAPQAAEGWGGLARSYAFVAHANPATAAAMKLRAEGAIAHALQLDPHNATAFAAKAIVLPLRGAWAQKDGFFREGLKYNPQADELLLSYADFLLSDGRCALAADMTQRAARVAPLDPSIVWIGLLSYWSANRLAEADTLAAQGIALFPRHHSVWFTRLALLMFTGRMDQALAALADRDSRPLGIPEEEFESQGAVATALKSRSRPDIEKAMNQCLALAHKGAGYAENAIGYAAALGEIDTAFQLAEGLYFGRGFTVGGSRFSQLQGVYTVLEDRRTRTLFLPPTRPMRRDPRFAALVDELGLTRYWQQAGVQPDYQTVKDG